MDAKLIINKILEEKALNAKTFSAIIGLKRPQAIYDIQTGKTRNISRKMCDSILKIYPDINKIWLLTGEGNMYINDEVVSIQTSTIVTIPLVSQYAYAGYLTGYGDNEFILPDTHLQL
jgi:hypothetical protein